MKNYIVLSLLMLAYLFCLNNNALGGLGIAWHPFPIQLHPGETTDVWFGLQISGSVPITVRQTITEDLASIASLPEGAEYIDYIVTPNVTMGAVTPIVVTIPDDILKKVSSNFNELKFARFASIVCEIFKACGMKSRDIMTNAKSIMPAR